MDLEARKQLAIDACKQIGTILLDNFGREFKVESKGDRDLVTDVDKKAEEVIIRLIRKHFPQDGILSEESPAVLPQSGFRWIIDPIDGTHNFVHNIAIFGTSCALEFQGEVVLGLINMPVSGELYLAEKEKGAICNGKKISVSKRTLPQATLIYDSSLRLNKKEMLCHLGKFAGKVFNVRMFGSTVRGLTFVAEGRADIEIEFNDKLWDFAAGLLLVEEAGGKCTDLQGRAWNTNTKGYIASNRALHQQLLQVIREV